MILEHSCSQKGLLEVVGRRDPRPLFSVFSGSVLFFGLFGSHGVFLGGGGRVVKMILSQYGKTSGNSSD